MLSRDAGPADDQRDAASRVIGSLVVTPDIQLSQVLSVIGAHDHNRVVQHSLVGQCVEKPPDVLIGVADSAVVPVKPTLHRIDRVDLLGHSGIALVEIVRSVVMGFLRTMRTEAFPAAPAKVFVHPGRRWLILERVAETGWCPVGGMWIPVVDVKEPVIAFCVALNPVERQRRHVIGEFLPAKSWIVHLAPSRVPMPRGVALAKWANRCRVKAQLRETSHPSEHPELVAKRTAGAFNEWISGCSAMVHSACVKSGAPTP